MSAADETVSAEGATRGASPLERGDLVGRYVVLSLLGAGGMGVVYAAYDPELDRKVALKLLHARSEGAEPSEGHRRLVREAQAMAKLSHPNVITVHDVGEHGGRVFLAMEFVAGMTLARYLKQGQPWRDVLDVFVRAGQGLAAAHEKGLIHRDFKPDNVMIGDDGRVRVMDFGLARTATESVQDERDQVQPTTDALRSDLTRKGSLVGTPAYMAPEQHLDAEVGAHADQFSFCVALYEALHGERPFAGETVAALAFNVTQGELRSAPAGTKVPGWLRKVVVRGLATEPAERFPSIDALLEALARDPALSRRRWAGGALMLAAVGATFVGAWTIAAQHTETCVNLDAKLTELWNDERRGEIEQAMLGSSATYASDTWERLNPILDAYGEQWIAQREEACEATQLRQEQSSERLERRNDCLDEALRELGALLDLLSTADEGVIENAVSAASGLMPVDSCADAGFLESRVLPPRDPDQRVEVARVRDRLAAARAMEVAARFDDGAELAQSLVKEAAELGYEPLIAEASLRLGSLLVGAGRLAEGEAELERAYFSAAGGRHPRVAAEAASRLTRVVGYGFALARTEEGLRWGRHAEAAVRRLHEPGLAEGLRLRNTADVLHSQRKFDEAVAGHQKALEIYERLLGPDHLEVALTLDMLGRSFRKNGELDRARLTHQRSLQLRTRVLGTLHPSIASPLNDLGNLHLVANEFDAGRGYYEKALYIAETTLGRDHPKVAAFLINLNHVYFELGRIDEALALHRRAVDIREHRLGPRHHLVGWSYLEIGGMLAKKGDLVEAVRSMEHGVEIYVDVLGETHTSLWQARVRLGKTLADAGRASEAVGVLELALASTQQWPGIRSELLADNRFALARALWQTGRRAPAAEHARVAREGFEAAADKGEAGLAELRKWLDAHGVKGIK